MNQLTADQKKKAAAMSKLNARLLLTIAVLDSDVNFAADEWGKHPDSQFWRRTLIRCICALVEGTLGMIKNVTPQTATYFSVALTERDIEIITEQRRFMEQGVEKKRPVFLPFPENIKMTFKLFAKAHAVEAAMKCEEPGFEALCQTFQLRNKLMHPKEPFDVDVSDMATDAADCGMKWFDSNFRHVLRACSRKLPFAKPIS
jgi:hypothetical protein